MATAAAAWDLSSAKTGVFNRVGGGKTRVNVEEEVPAAIRMKLEELLAANLFKDGDARTVYLDWDTGSADRAAEFKSLAQRYGKYRQAGRITVRVTVFDDTWVHFTAKPLEQRNAAPAA